MTTLADKAILSGVDNRPPMLEKDMYDSWKSIMELYMMNRQHGRMILESVENGPLNWPSIEETGVTRPKKYSELSALEAIQADCDVKATTIILQGLPPKNTTEEKICKKNDVKARSLLLMALPNEQQLTFNQYAGAQSMFIATSSESLDSIFNRLQKLVSRLAILGVDTPPEDLNVKFLRSLPSEWDTHVVVWMNKPDFETMGLDDLYNNFKIVKQKVKRTVAVNNDDKNLAFLTTSSPSSTNTINTANTGVSTGNTKVNTASTETSTASFSDATVYAFLSTQPQGSQLVHEDLEQIHDDDLEEMDLKWNMALLSMRARKFYQRTRRKIIIDGSKHQEVKTTEIGIKGSHRKAVRIEDAPTRQMYSESNFHQLTDKRDFNMESGCSRHMSGNIAHLSVILKTLDGGYVTFGGGANGGKITGKENVLCLSPNFKLPDESQILLKIPRQNNMYSFDMKNIVPKDGLTCLVAKATSEESMLWHRRLGHVNFKNINKLVKENLVRDLPLKRFENDQTCVACLKGKQHRASCKTKAFSPTTKPLFMLHMDLFGPTFVSSLMHKKYCLVVTDDYSRFSWVFFLRTKDETSEILKNCYKKFENLVDKKVKIIRSDNGTEFKNHVMDEFCREKGIKREYSVARTPQQNGVAERKNRTLIEAARTMLS
ncbi:putative ribonuclease H-like domain-containing protein [Tanacetum coccineum]|uniref:Ribonuclease H-like domain-containing protein n=1 Tax=Tanacetum coccineum TaxID=301880 RepID=A0ABQ4YTI5_9ASTR